MVDVIAVTGVTGYVGSRVAASLSELGASLKLVARRPDEIPEDLAGERVYGSYGEQEAMTRAFEGASTVFLVSGREHPERLEQHRRAVAAAVDAGAERIVYLSFLNAAPDATFTLGRQHYHSEQSIRAAGLSFVFLRDSLYADFLPYFVGDGNIIRAPAGDGRVSLVTRDDIAEAAVAVITDRTHDNQIYDITGPDAPTLAEAAHRLGTAIGQPIEYRPETEAEAFESRSVYGAPDWEVEGWVTSYLAIANGEMETVSGDVEALTGHPARSIEQFLEANPDSYRRLVPG